MFQGLAPAILLKRPGCLNEGKDFTPRILVVFFARSWFFLAA